ncbi:MAG: SAM-dependent chlorinase/fluorinase, partial [Acidobacteria bacterium]|nr:SAM-dependent chlorinase/fluorinase [Acidobacteriota bacterium]
MKSRRSIIALLTDFGTRDPYVGAMKGVITSRSSAEVLDLSHEIAPFDPFEAGWFLRLAGPAFLPEAGFIERVVIVAVVDPGVGSSRRILAALDRGCFYLAPDNGLLNIALSSRATFVSVENERLFLPQGSTTFHGRDRFAPVAAALAEGMVGIDDLGSPVERSEIEALDYHEPIANSSGVTGTVIAIDRFGNIITDIEAPEGDREISVRLG